MATVRIKGLNRKTVRAADGRPVDYWYAWKGGPRLPGRPGDPEFMAAHAEAVAARKTALAGPPDTLAALVARYRAAPEFTRLAPATRAEWARWLDRIALARDPAAGQPHASLDIGDLPLAFLDDRRVRRDLLAWRDQWHDRPRSADYAMQVLGRVLAFGFDRGELALNVAAGVAQLYDPEGRGDQVWTADELARFAAAAPSPEVARIVQLACLTGLRRADLCRLRWDQVGDVAIVIPTSKSRNKRAGIIPLLPETHALLKAIRADQAARHAALTARANRAAANPKLAARYRPAPPPPATVLTNTRGRQWTPHGLESQVIKTKAAAAPAITKHLHDARGTFVTRLRHAGLKASEIADTVGWTESRVERLLRTYVDQTAIVLDLAERLQARGKGKGKGKP